MYLGFSSGDSGRPSPTSSRAMAAKKSLGLFFVVSTIFNCNVTCSVHFNGSDVHQRKRSLGANLFTRRNNSKYNSIHILVVSLCLTTIPQVSNTKLINSKQLQTQRTRMKEASLLMLYQLLGLLASCTSTSNSPPSEPTWRSSFTRSKPLL